MPTENRSTMISVPRDEVERLVKLLAYQAHPYPSPHAEYWQGILDAPVKHQGEPFAWFDPKNSHFITADGRATALSMGHGDRLERYSVPLYIHPVPAEPVAEVRYMGYEPSNHLNWLNGCDLQLLADGTKLYTHPAPAEQQEPVCEVVDMKYNRVQFYRHHGDSSKPYLQPGVKLYTHADPGEVERLVAANTEYARRHLEMNGELAQCESMAAMIAEREWAEHIGTGPASSKVEAAFTQLHNDLHEAGEKLAERDALLLDTKSCIERNDYPVFELMKRIDVALSARAEPSAPVERDERAKLIREVLDLIDDGVGRSDAEWQLIQKLRAALERKP